MLDIKIRDEIIGKTKCKVTEKLVRIGFSKVYLGTRIEETGDGTAFPRIIIRLYSDGGHATIDSAEPIFKEQAKDLIKLLSEHL